MDLANNILFDPQRFCKEVLVAKLIENDNVLSIEGVQIVNRIKLCIISEWMEHGNMHAYIEKNQKDVDRVELVSLRLRLLCPVSNPLRIAAWGDKRARLLTRRRGGSRGSKKRKLLISPIFSRSANFETQTNILIDSNHNPRLTDFGVSSVTRNLTANASTESARGTMRWKAPELLPLSTDVRDWDRVKSARPTNESDMYSLAMVVIEVPVPCLTQIPVPNSFEHPQIFTGKYPFEPHSNEQVIILLTRNKRPEKPTHGQLNSKIWSLTRECWNKDPKKRPAVSEVLKKLESSESAFSAFHPPHYPLFRKNTGNNLLQSLSVSLGAFFGSRISL